MPLVRRLVPRRRLPAAPSHVPAPDAGLLLDLAADWYWQTDEHLVFTVVRPTRRMRAQLGLPAPGQLPWQSDTSSDTPPWAWIRRTMEAREPFEGWETSRLDALGKLRHVRVSGRPQFDADGRFTGYSGIGVEVTSHKEAQQALDATEVQLAAVIDAAMDAVITVDGNGRVVLFNQAAGQMLGCSRAQALGAGLDTWMPQALQFIRAAQAGVPGSGPLLRGVALEARRSNGETFHLEASVTRIEVHGSTLYCLTARDLTRALAAEEARQSLESQLRQSQKMEALGTLAGGIAHDFNNIVAAILGNARLARDRCEPQAAAQPFITEISNAGLRARDLVQRILAFTRETPAAYACQPLQPLVREGVQLLRAMLPSGIELQHVEPDEPLVVSTDPTQISQVLMNLGTNAWQAIGRNPGRITIALARDNDDACLSVSDSGCGMDPTTLERIFEPFFTTKAKGEGTGLGLPVVHGIVTAHGGRITVDSRPGDGTTFRIWLPLEADAAPAVELPEPAAPAAGAPQPGTGQHVLYLDDYPAMVFMVKAMLEAQGYRVTGFEDPAIALDWLRAHPTACDLVVTDYNMPGFSGLELAAQIRQLRLDLPLILASGYITDDLLEGAAALDVEHVFDKPRGIEELCALVGQVLRTRTTPTEAA